jgi:hypothetical protein
LEVEYSPLKQLFSETLLSEMLIVIMLSLFPLMLIQQLGLKYSMVLLIPETTLL